MLKLLTNYAFRRLSKTKVIKPFVTQHIVKQNTLINISRKNNAQIKANLNWYCLAICAYP
jgi:hypothetical protein